MRSRLISPIMVSLVKTKIADGGNEARELPDEEMDLGESGDTNGYIFRF